MASSIQPQPPPSDGSSHGNRLRRWLSRLSHRTTNNNPSATNPVEVQQEQLQPIYEQSHSGTISSENNTVITPGSLSLRRHRRRSRWRRVFRRPRRGKANPGFDLTEVGPHRGFSPPRNRQQPEWMRQSRDDVADRVGKSGESDRRSKEAGGETDVARGAEGTSPWLRAGTTCPVVHTCPIPQVVTAPEQMTRGLHLSPNVFNY